MTSGHYDDEEYEVPLTDQRIFGAGLKRKRVQFVPSSSESTTAEAIGDPTSEQPGSSNPYRRHLATNATATHEGVQSTASHPEDSVGSSAPERQDCPICHLPIAPDATHHASIAHQVCLPHAHPPSSIDRRRKGVAMMTTHGWDPDQRHGLGSTGQGILYPVVAREKVDKYGVGLVSSALDDTSTSTKAVKPARKREAPRNLDAGKVRARHDQQKKDDQRMREGFYGDEDVQKYLYGDDG